jgi:hypothetical protein
MHKLATRLEFQLLIGYGFRFKKLKMIQRKIGWCDYSLYRSMLNVIARTITKYKTFSWLFLEEFLNHLSVCYSISIRIWNCAPREMEDTTQISSTFLVILASRVGCYSMMLIPLIFCKCFEWIISEIWFKRKGHKIVIIA